MALYLEGKISVGTNDLSPKEATQMRSDIKYIGSLLSGETSAVSAQAMQIQ